MSAVFDLSIIINFRKSYGLKLGKRKREKLKETGTIGKKSKFERRMLKFEGDFPL